MKTKYRILLWDMDGTIMDSQEGLIRSIDYTFEKCGLPRETTETYRSYLGPSLKHTFRTHYHLSDEKADEAVEVFRLWFHDHGMLQGNHMFAGIRELLTDLKAAGYNAEGLISEGTAHEFLTWRRCLRQMAQSLFK